MFTYDVQLAGYPHEKFDAKGQTNYDHFTSEFEGFPWLEQVDKYHQLKDGCSATLSITATADNKSFWISIAGDTHNHFFLVGYVYLKTKTGLFGFGKEKTVKWVEIYEADDKEQIKILLRLFFDKEFSLLETKIRQLKKFDEMEAYIQ